MCPLHSCKTPPALHPSSGDAQHYQPAASPQALQRVPVAAGALPGVAGGRARRGAEQVGRLAGVVPSQARVVQEALVPQDRPHDLVDLEVGRPPAHHLPGAEGVWDESGGEGEAAGL